ncbi:Bud site selection protein 6 [Sporothrix stenoceras]|uniref:Bud site selection protein 6 n=1 Tax=Sporothrix stenoceras TaxID=5173 RepID=A0ABR3ZGF8_9PEZI
MQAPGPMQRQMQRRSPGAENGQGGNGMPNNILARAMSPAMGGMSGPGMPRPSASSRSVGGGSAPGGSAPGARRANTSSGSGPGSGAGPGASANNANVPLSQIEKSVTHLLVATKQLLETLTQWSRGQATDTQVSDVYVRLGYEFNMACRAFTAINVDTSDLGNVPELLRNILESTLSQEASSESLEKYLPRIRDIIINLLHGLKRKQQKLRQKQARDRESSTTVSSTESLAARANSLSTSGSAGSGLTTLLNESIEGGYGDPQGYTQSQQQQQQQQSQQQPPQLPPSRDDVKSSSPNRRFIPPRDQSRGSVNSEQSSMSSSTMQSMPVMPPYPDGSSISLGTSASMGELNIDSFPPPPPPKSQQSALMALQRNGDHLERRASRRYSTYHIQKHLGGSISSGVPLMPPPQTTPIPNRGRGEVRESMRAVQGRNGRSSSSMGRNGNGNGGSNYESSPMRNNVPDGKEVVTTATAINTDMSARRDDSPMAKTPDDKYPQPSATLNGPPVDLMPALPVTSSSPSNEERSPVRRRADSNEARTEAERARSINAAQAALVGQAPPPATSVIASPPPAMPAPATTQPQAVPASKELTLFLQYKSKVKKFVLPEGYSELTIGRLQLAFIEKFSWNTQQNGADLPEIYIQDPISGVRHELDDLADIKDRTVLALNVEPLDEVKRHIDEGIGALKSMVQQVKQNVDEQGAALQRVSDRQQEASKEMARMAAAPVQPMTPPADSPRSASMGSAPASSLVRGGTGVGKRFSNQQMAEVQSLRRDLAVLRQTYSNFQSDIESSMTALRNKAANVKTAVAETAIPDFEGGQGQAIVAAGRKKLSAESDRLVTKVDDLQDLVEDLRKDVVHRGVRPLPRQLELVTKDITQLAKDLTKMEEGMKRDKPIWTKIWEKELEEVCKGRDELQLAEDLLVDLQDDLEKASETFALVEQATKEQMKDAGVNGGPSPGAPGGPGGSPNGLVGGMSLISRQLSRGLRTIGDSIGNVDPNAAKEGVLGEVRALQPNHENRLEAIERAEKLRQKELESRKGNPLLRELTGFVEEGKLKKSGGFEEVERARKAKDDRIRREVWERMNGPVGGEEEEEYEEDEEGEYEEGEEGEDVEGEEGEAEGEAAAEGAEGETANGVVPGQEGTAAGAV